MSSNQMAAGFIRQITVSGVLGTDPETKDVRGSEVTEARMAVSQGREEPSMWFGLSCWNKGAQTVLRRCAVGTKLVVTGRLQMREYESRKTGKTEQAWSIRVDNLFASGVSTADNVSTRGGSDDFPF